MALITWFNLINNEIPNVQDTYPPYDILRTGEDSYRISIALAGFTPEQISVVAEQNRLTVAAKKSRPASRITSSKALPRAPSNWHFSLADHVEVAGATFENGLLEIDLVRKVPEAMKPRRVNIGTGQSAANEPKVLEHEARDTRPQGAKAA